MSDQEYKKKLESLQKYIPFLINMMVELKAKGNREAQLAKIQSLHDMITDTRKKLKFETLNRCEEVLTNIYFKVNPQLRSSRLSGTSSPSTLPGIESPRSTPQSPSPPRDIIPTVPVTIPTEKVETHSKGFDKRSSSKSNRPRIDVYSNAVINNPTKAKVPLIGGKFPDMSKPPISLDDLKTLEDDVQKKISDSVFLNKSVDELQEVKKQIQLQLRVDEITASMNDEKSADRTVCNKATTSQKSSSSEGNIKVKESIRVSKHFTSDKSAYKGKDDDKLSKGNRVSKKSLKDIDIFGNVLSSIDDKLLEEKKKFKKGDRRSSVTLAKEDTVVSAVCSDKANNKEIETKKGKESKDKTGESSIFKPSDKEKKTENKRDGTKSDIIDTFRSVDKKASNHCPEAENKQAKHNIKDIKEESSKKTVNVCHNLEVNSKASDEMKSQKTPDNASMDLSETKDTSNAVKPVSPLKRLADKYNPKPKPKTDIIDIPDVEKTVSDSIEKLMKVSSVKALPRSLDQSDHGIKENEMTIGSLVEKNKPVQLPEILQRIFSKPLLGDIIPKRLNDPIASPSHATHNRLQNSDLGLDRPAIMQPSEMLVPSSSQSIQYQSPCFLSPPRPPEMLLSPDAMGRPPLSTPSSGHGILPSPPIPPSLPAGFMDHNMDLNFATPRMDFQSPGTPMPEFNSPRMEFERTTFIRNENFNFNQRFAPRTAEYQMHGFDPRNPNFMGQGHFTHQPEVNTFNPLNQGPAPFYNRGNQMPVHITPEVPHYMPDPSFYQERSHWAKERRPGDPRNYREHREHKEMRERQEREAKAYQERQKEIKDPRLAPRESRDTYGDRDPRLGRDASDSLAKDKVNIAVRDPRLSRGRAKSVDGFKDSNDVSEEDKSRDREFSRSRPQSRDSFKNPSTPRDPRGREGKPESNKFDKMYSVTNRARSPSSSRNREDKHEEEESFLSPLNSLYNAGEKGKTGRGYGVQHFRIPRKAKGVDEQRLVGIKETKSNVIVDRSRRIIEISESDDSDSNNVDDEPVRGNGSSLEDSEEEKDTKDTKVATIQKGNSDIDISRIKVVLKPEEKASNIWDSSNTDEFISEYDREFKDNKNKPSGTPLSVNQDIAIGNKLKDSEGASNMEFSDVQFEEPSSSQDVLEKSSNENICVDSFKKPAKPAEVDSSKKSDDLVTPQETNIKNDEPSEQNILAHFFENLLKSSNKKDKKTALFSLIETFSDSFDDKEIKKIRKIIKVDEDAEDGNDGEKEDSDNLQNQRPVVELHNNDSYEEQAIVGSTTEEPGPSENTKATTVTKDDISEESFSTNETQVNEVTKSTDESDLQSNEDLKSDESVSQSKDRKSDSVLEPVLVSVGERIKNRKRNPSGKPRKKFKSELDLLHEDIQDMFIRDGVLTATGKRMCRILKDDPNALISGDQTKSTLANDQPKKTRKKPGPKPKIKVINQEVYPSSLKDMRVVINKMPDDVLHTTRQLRNRSKQNYVETEDETLEPTVDDASFSGSFEVASDKSDLEGESSNESEDDKNSTTDDMPKPRTKRRKIAKWASGIIPKVKNKNKKKLQHNKSKENSPERISSPASLTPSDSASFSEFHMDKFLEPDKDYYYDYANKQKLKCKLCKYSGQLLTGHYLKEHPQSEVLCSRFSPEVAAEAIKDFSDNGKLFESIVSSKMSTKYHYSCRMCGYNSFVSPIFFYEHVTTHTGEYRHQCGLCEFFSVTSKTMAVHFSAIHPDQERKAIKKTYPLAVVFAYMCGECNFVQLEEKSVHDHANIFHLGEKPPIFKINMSTTIDPQLIKSSEFKAIESKQNDDKPGTTEPLDIREGSEVDSLLETSTRRKPGPKSRVGKKQITVENEIKLVTKKRPGPKSKTCIPESDSMKVTDQSPPMPVRKKPGPKSKTQYSLAEETSAGTSTVKQTNEQEATVPQIDIPVASISLPSKDISTRKRRRSLDKLISEDSGDDLDTIITLSSRSSRVAKEKATAKLKTMIENNEGSPTKRRSDSESSKKDKENSIEKNNQQSEVLKSSEKTGNETFENEVEEKSRILETKEKNIQMAIKNSDFDGKDLNVFTCKNDILQEDAKKIEEDRLRQMDELNKSIVSRALKLDFITKLSNKLTKDQESDERVIIKTEPTDSIVSNLSSDIAPQFDENPLSLPITKTSHITNICKSPIVSKKPVFEEESVVHQPSIKFRQDKSNSLFSNMIEKLQGKLNEAAVQEESTTNNMDSALEEPISNDNQMITTSQPFIIIGDLVRATKINNEIIYSCHANNCYVATKDKMVFQLHCKFGHKDLNIQSSLCERCGVVVEITPDTTLLENLYDHLVFAHSDFIGKSSALRMRRLSGDKLSIKKEKEVMSSTTKAQDFEAGIDHDILRSDENQSVIPQSVDPMTGEIESSPSVANEEKATLEPAEDNPFSFKIASVMSLADSKENQSVKSSAATKPISKTKSALPSLPPLKFVPPLTLINSTPKQQTSAPSALVVKEAKLTTSELSRPKKAPKALQKFKDCPGDLYKCPHFYCMFSTNVRTLLMCHLKAHKCDSATMVPCVYCDMKTPWEHVPMHIDIRHASSKYSCSHCLYRAALKEYVVLHQEQAHPNLDYVVLVLPSHKAAKKFSIADSKTDYKGLCEPFRCFCCNEGDAEFPLREYLFETEFMQHLNGVHPNDFISCGYPKCGYKVNTSMMLNHWAMFHGVCTYQCGYCKTSSKEISKMYTHFSQMHPNMNPDILVRKNDFLPQDRELGFSEDAFQKLGHIRKVPSNLLTTIGKRAQRTVKLVPLNTHSGSPEEFSASIGCESPTSGIPQGTLVSIQPLSTLHNVPSTSVSPQLLLSNSSLKLIVASTSGNNEKLYLLPTSMVSQRKGQSVTSIAPISKVTVQTSTASKSSLIGSEALPLEPIKIGSLSAANLPTSINTQGPKKTSSPSPSLNTGAVMSQSLLTTTVSVSSIAPQHQLCSSAATHDVRKVLSAKEPIVTAKIKTVLKGSDVSSINNEFVENSFLQDDLISENDNTAISEDDMLQSAIQSILEQDDDSNNSSARLETFSRDNRVQTPSSCSASSPLLSEIVLPPLVPITDSKADKTSSISPNPVSSNNPISDSVAPVEHIEITGNLDGVLEPEEEDPLNLGSNDDSNFTDNDIVDPLSEDRLTVTTNLTLGLSSGDPLSIDESLVAGDPLATIITPSENSAVQSTEDGERDPLKISSMPRSVSMASTSDDESDSSSEKRKRGLIGYQLFRCAVCNLSFSNVKTFKAHIGNASQCRMAGPRAFQCVHCDKVLKTPQRLADHIMIHGVQRFACSLCNEKFTTIGITKLHMKNRHSIHQTNLIPSQANRNDMEIDDFIAKPCQPNPPNVKDKDSTVDNFKLTVEECTYTPDQINAIPIRQIFNTNVKCGLCNYQTKVRVNIIRHLQMHLDEKSVPDSAPVNPVPCLEKNEKMFDKMINLAASSVTTSGRMGGHGKEKEEDDHPEFVPSHRRFVCCAQGCSYLCPEEANLKHHLVALHSDESHFTCAHCKVKIEPIDIENVMKHFKLHGLHLYKCQYCNFIHHLKHKIDRHIIDGHLDMAVKVVTIRSMDSEPQEFTPQDEAVVTTPQISLSSKFKPWNCCMCKAKYHAKADIQSHIMKKHNIDAQYKCTLCAFKDDQEDKCRDHFKEKHPSQVFDIVLMYQKIEEDIPKDDPISPFDTTPLWQRDKPRVRHIRGILFDESSPQPTKSPKKSKTYVSNLSKLGSGSVMKILTNVSPKETPNVSTSTTPNADTVFACIDAVARGVAGVVQGKPGSNTTITAKKVTAINKRDETPLNSELCNTDKNFEASPLSTETKTNVKENVTDETTNDDVMVIPQSPNIIVIDSDESDPEGQSKSELKDESKTRNSSLKRQGTTDLLKEAVKMAKIEELDDEDYLMASSCSRQNLISMFGEFGSPHNKQWKCPKCNQFKSKRVGDFMFHLYKDFNIYRYRCRVCSDLSITYKYMLDHMKCHPGRDEDIIETLPSNIKLDTWIHMVLREQSLVILKNAPLFKKRPLTGHTDITCYFCNEKFMSMPECCEHMLYHWVMMPYQCQHCPHEFYTVYDLKHHQKIEHPDAKLYEDPKGPTLSKAIQCIENLKKRSSKLPQETAKKKLRTEENVNVLKGTSEDITCGVVINTYKGKRSKSNSSPKPVAADIINLEDDDDDLVIVSKTDDTVSNEDNVFACDICAYIADFEPLVVKHLVEKHKIKIKKYHSLSKKYSETDPLQFACNICDAIFSELKLRRHFLENHLESHTYAPYRYYCGVCFVRFLNASRVRTHFIRFHPDQKVNSQCVMKKTYVKKQYVCPLCSHTSVSPTPISIRAHLRSHLKPILCNHCNMRFRYQKEVLVHTSKEHSGMEPNSTILDDVEKEFTETIKVIMERATVMPDEDKSNSSNVSLVLSNDSMKNIAKKSTSAPFLSPKEYPEEREQSNFYEMNQEELDLSKIRTTFELDKLEYTTTAEQMMKMINLDTYVDMSDCVVKAISLNPS